MTLFFGFRDKHKGVNKNLIQVLCTDGISEILYIYRLLVLPGVGV